MQQANQMSLLTRLRTTWIDQRGNRPHFVDARLRKRQLHRCTSYGAIGCNRLLNSTRNNHQLTIACSVTDAIERYHTCSMRKFGCIDSHTVGTANAKKRVPELISEGIVLPKP